MILASEITKATLQGKFDEENPLNRYFPLIGLENVENVRAETVFQEFNSGKRVKIRKGYKQVTAFLPNAPYALLEAIKSFGCSEIGAFGLDSSNGFVYRRDSSDTANAYPIVIDNDTWDAMYVEGTDSETPGIMITFQWASDMKDENLRVVEFADHDITQSDLYGLVDADAAFSAISTTGFTATITTVDYGEAVEGLVSADFVSSDSAATDSIFNVTQDADVAISSVTESSPGVYDFTFAAQVSADEMRLYALKSRYDFAPMKDGTNDVTIP